ncbi:MULTISPECIES: hypothetical protein [Oceanisphaera]|uniref:Uncharacterized protein n=1 Tax=Oceanisphaera ostreae TaxID=914151 RepID=A0ABW3KKU4_9GAMM
MIWINIKKGMISADKADGYIDTNERVYLEALAHKLNLPTELVAHLEQQILQGIIQQGVMH